MAGEDKEALKQLDQFTEPGAVFKSFRELRTQRDSGALKAVLPDNATPEQVAAYRKSNNLPDTPEAYVEKLALPNGVVLGEADKPLVADFVAKVAHAKAWSQAQVNDVMAWYHARQDATRVEQDKKDEQYQLASVRTLTEAFGKEYDRNENAVGNFIATVFPAELGDQILTARLPDGSKLGDNPAVVQALAAAARQLMPTATLVPMGDGGKTLATRKTELEDVMRKAMGNDHDAQRVWYSRPGKPGLDAEYTELLAAEQTMKARGRAA